MRHLTKDKGDLGVARTLPDLLEHGIRACLPLSEHLPFDLIAVMPDFTTLRRVQVKYRTEKDGYIELPFRSNYYDSKRIYSVRVNFDEVDCYAIYCPDSNQVYYVRVDELDAEAIAIRLRLRPTKNNQRKRVWWADDYVDPCRIAPHTEAPLSRKRPVTELDEYALSKVIAHLVGQGIQPCLAQSQYLPFDLIAVFPDMQNLKRVRVGWESVERSSYADWYVIYDPGQQRCETYSPDEVPQRLIRKAVG